MVLILTMLVWMLRCTDVVNNIEKVLYSVCIAIFVCAFRTSAQNSNPPKPVIVLFMTRVSFQFAGNRECR